MPLPPSSILVVDDDEAIREIVASSLSFAGFSATTAADGFDALRSVKANRPDLVVLDVSMPDLDGFEVCRRLRRDGFDMPVIFLSARDDIDDLRAGFHQGGDDYLTKPFSIEELGLRIQALLRRNGGTAKSAKLVAGDLVLDEDAHRVLRGDRQIELSPTEFRLLRFLLLNQGRVMSKDQIVNHVWEYDFDGNDSIVETYISYVRKKIGDPGGNLVQTVRGFGYVLRAAPDGP